MPTPAREPAATWRCFVALPVPTETALGIDRRLAPLRDAWPDARWSPVGDLHLTVAFLGAVRVGDLPGLEAALAGVAATAAPFALRLSGAGTFGGRGRPRVAWLGVGDGAPAIGDLAARIGVALDAATPEKARPHVTLARRAPVELAAELRHALADDPPAWRAEALVLFRSHLGPPRARYEILASWRLGAR
jgi:2'-5' RNA ligase